MGAVLPVPGDRSCSLSREPALAFPRHPEGLGGLTPQSSQASVVWAGHSQPPTAGCAPG